MQCRLFIWVYSKEESIKHIITTDDAAWQEVEIADWEKFVGIIAGNILEEQTPQKLLSIRGQVYELLAACIPPDMIMQVCKTTRERKQIYSISMVFSRIIIIINNVPARFFMDAALYIFCACA
jgi:hypothetical protein